MTDSTRFNSDLPNHAADKVKRAMDDVLQLTEDTGEMFRIALMAASVPIGAAAGILSARSAQGGHKMSETDATVQILDFLKVSHTEGPAAAFRKLGLIDGEGGNKK